MQVYRGRSSTILYRMDTKKIAVVTGANSGIGREFARLLAQDPAVEEIWAIARNEERLSALHAELGDRVRTYSLDLADRKNFDVLEGLFRDSAVRIAYLVNCAGFAKFCDYGGIDRDTSLNMIDVNCAALVALCLACIPYMEPGAHILNMASQAAFQPVPYQNIYSATKAFVRNYTRALNVELRPKGIVATAVCPGWMDTRLIERGLIAGEKGTNYFPHTVPPAVVAAKALYDAQRGKDMSVYGAYVKTAHLLAKLLPQRLVMRVWCKQQKL